MDAQLNIRLATNFDLPEFTRLLPEIKLYDEKDNQKIDLLIFPGGEDVCLDEYLSQPEIGDFENLCMTNRARDTREKKIFYEAIDNERAKKILGICRGAQFLNVMCGGILFPDLRYFELQHPSIHLINHRTRNNLQFFQSVNSLHHQGVRRLGDRIKDRNIRSRPVEIATDYTGYVGEIFSYLNDRILGIQFHPEYYYEENPDKQQFRKFLYAWAKEEISILK